MLYNDGVEVYQTASWTTGAQTLVIDPTGYDYEMMTLAGWETAILEIRLIGADLVETEYKTMGGLKRMFR